MSLLNENSAQKLIDLINRCYDSEKGFSKVSEHIEDPILKVFFIDKSRERYAFVKQLRAAYENAGLEVETINGTISGDMHRVWIDTKALFAIDKEEAMLQEVKVGENVAIEDYDDIIKNYDLTTNIKKLLINQRDEIANSLEKADYFAFNW